MRIEKILKVKKKVLSVADCGNADHKGVRNRCVSIGVAECR